MKERPESGSWKDCKLVESKAEHQRLMRYVRSLLLLLLLLRHKAREEPTD